MAISFYPGPSTVHREVPDYVKEAYEQGILSTNHRSHAFAEVMQNTLQLLKRKLNIPDGYEIVFTSSATECWEVIAQSLLTSKSFHIFNGDFGKKWFQYTQKLVSESKGFQFDINEEIRSESINIDEDVEIICFTQNETSNGTQVTNGILAEFRNLYPDKLIAVDATSSMGGIILDFQQADIWYGSVQKCFGLPAGLGLLICSPAAVARAYDLNENKHYNSMVFMMDNVRNLQTHYTPNVLGIYLLMRVLMNSSNISEVDKRLNKRLNVMNQLLSRASNFNSLIKNEKVKSTTVFAVKSTPEFITDIKKEAEKEGILLGSGYGSFKKDTFRIANFPAIPDADFNFLEDFLNKYNSKYVKD